MRQQEKAPTSTKVATGKPKKDKTGASVLRSSRILIAACVSVDVRPRHLFTFRVFKHKIHFLINFLLLSYSRGSRMHGFSWCVHFKAVGN